MSFRAGAHGDDFDFDGRGHTLAHAFYPGQKGRSGQVHLDADENWSLYGYHVGETSLLMVTLHEIGHALGKLLFTLVFILREVSLRSFGPKLPGNIKEVPDDYFMDFSLKRSFASR